MEQINNKQNERITRLEERFKSLKETFDRFLDNDFKHLDAKVNKLFLLVLVGVLIPILLYIIEK